MFERTCMTSLQVALGRTIVRLRKEKDLSQEALALKCGIARTYMTGVERGRHNLSLELLERIAKGLETDTGKLLTAAEQERGTPSRRSR
jgi:transcriptional regulator with XRE-family HTH domain